MKPKDANIDVRGDTDKPVPPSDMSPFMRENGSELYGIPVLPRSWQRILARKHPTEPGTTNEADSKMPGPRLGMGLVSRKTRRRPQEPRPIRANSSIEIAKYAPASSPLDDTHLTFGSVRARFAGARICAAGTEIRADSITRGRMEAGRVGSAFSGTVGATTSKGI